MWALGPSQIAPEGATVCAMEQRYLGLFALALVACGPSYSSGGDVKTPDQLIAEQEKLGDEQLKNQRNSSDYADTTGPTEDEKLHGWDEKQGNLELMRAAHSAEFDGLQAHPALHQFALHHVQKASMRCSAATS